MAHEIAQGAVRPRSLARVAARLALWRRNLRTRRSLALLSDDMLRDIGLTEAQAGREIRKPFWQ